MEGEKSKEEGEVEDIHSRSTIIVRERKGIRRKETGEKRMK